MIWPLMKLGELVTIKGGGTPSKKIEGYWNGNIPWASVKDLKSNEISKTVDAITELGVNNSATNIIPAGTILTATRMALGKFAINTVDMAINQDLKALFINDETKVDRDFLIRFLESKAQYIDSEGKGATVKGITLDFLKHLEIPLPPLDEQKRIAAILDKADAIRRKRQQAIQLADDFLRSVFLDMFGDPVTNPKGWEVSTLGKLACSFQNGTGKSKQFYGRGNKVANIGDLYEKPFFSPKKYSLLEVSEKEIQKYKLNRGDLLFVRSSVKREGVAFCSAYDSDELCLFSSFMIRMSVDKEKVEPKFLSIQLRVNSMRQQLIEASNTATITNINQEGLSKVRIIVPNIAAQQRFLLISEKVNELLERSDLSSISTNSCFNSLSQKAFAGEL
ncbi:MULTISPECIES: restriction endonuclease subunit S [unclassified Pseudoalteromonas]|uniref:restriction endonuclease subunit S n=1 Tax=unclassified Pseudoalteromonas TaxID=194690 RepID=UPI0016022773|nr:MULTISPECIES: restriction endonuclease subunit S [unclassified Pseudoalteromonas]MBB1350965.1 restriction endonuclease subunit S [Pseudoalteromonas sp. SG45-3]MBB1359503.1 restriction endonuclease subunit S [Pseudoalteromonas sp. SG45-6]